jgi:signal transduction histidine kinase
MSERRRLTAEYGDALRAHMATANETGLNRAYELGRQMLGEGFGVIDEVMLHSQALDRILSGRAPAAIRGDYCHAATFLAESLSAFEMSLRGYREANEDLACLQKTLEQRIAERTRELTDANRVKDDFLAMVSHELRTPLTAINVVLAMLAGDALGNLPPAMRQPVELAHRNCDRLIRIVDNLIDFTAISRGGFDLHLEPVDLVPILREAIESKQRFDETRPISFTVAESAACARVVADAPRLRQVFEHLLSNAAKFSDAGQRIEVGVERKQQRVRVAVKDHGIGIPEADHDRVFNAFTQADSSSTRRHGGIGLGLSIARALVEAHRGTIDYDATAGGGTTFYFDLPVEGAA